MERLKIPQSLAEWNERGKDYLSGHLDMEILAIEPDEVRVRMPIDLRKCAWNGFLHAGAVVSLADSACGVGTLRNLPEDAGGFLAPRSKAMSSAWPGPSTKAARRKSGMPRCARTRAARRSPSSAQDPATLSTVAENGSSALEASSEGRAGPSTVHGGGGEGVTCRIGRRIRFVHALRR